MQSLPDANTSSGLHMENLNPFSPEHVAATAATAAAAAFFPSTMSFATKHHCLLTLLS